MNSDFLHKVKKEYPNRLNAEADKRIYLLSVLLSQM